MAQKSVQFECNGAVNRDRIGLVAALAEIRLTEKDSFACISGQLRQRFLIALLNAGGRRINTLNFICALRTKLMRMYDYLLKYSKVLFFDFSETLPGQLR